MTNKFWIMLQTIDTRFYILILIITLSGCYTKLNGNKTPDLGLLDQSHIYLNIREDFGEWKGEALCNSLLNAYIDHSHRGLFCDLKSHQDYSIFRLGEYTIHENLYGELIRFQPDFNDCHSIQFYLIDARDNKIVDAIELSYSLSGEGAMGSSESYIIVDEQLIKLFTKLDWAIFAGSDAELVLEVDSMAYTKIEANKIVDYLPSGLEKQQVQRFFNN